MKDQRKHLKNAELLIEIGDLYKIACQTSKALEVFEADHKNIEAKICIASCLLFLDEFFFDARKLLSELYGLLPNDDHVICQLVFIINPKQADMRQ